MESISPRHSIIFQSYSKFATTFVFVRLETKYNEKQFSFKWKVSHAPFLFYYRFPSSKNYTHISCQTNFVTFMCDVTKFPYHECTKKKNIDSRQLVGIVDFDVCHTVLKFSFSIKNSGMWQKKVVLLLLGSQNEGQCVLFYGLYCEIFCCRDSKLLIFVKKFLCQSKHFNLKNSIQV